MTTARKLFALTLLAVLLVLPPATRGAPLQIDTPPHQPAITPTAEVGTLAGSFAVNDAGSATYRIPLELPAGTKGMVPGLALAYDSAAGNGQLGVGWSLAGTSTLGRCAPNLAVDGEVGPITFTSSDPLCLDGERLVVIDGEHWKPGAVYAKRRDDLSRVRLTSATACAGELGFEVRSADGLIHTYGCSEDALVRTPQGILRWSLSRTLDRFGNAIDYAYDYADVEVWSDANEFEGLARVDHRLAHVDYGGHEGEPSLEHDTRVVLRWDERPDEAHGWFGGAPTAATKRLQGISVYRSDALVRWWPLAYEQGKATGRSRLIGVTECAADGACKPATTLEWIEGEPATDDAPAEGWSLDGAAYPQLDFVLADEDSQLLAQVTLDANGDGMSDLLAGVGGANDLPPEGLGWERWLSQPSATAANGIACMTGQVCTLERYRVDAFPRSRVLSAGAGPTDAAQQQSFAIDLDGDGRDDVATSSPEGLAWNVDPDLAAALRHVVFVPGTDADELPSDSSIDLEFAWSFAATDLTGDGLGDLIYCRPQPDEVDDRIGTWRVIGNVPGEGLDPALMVDTGLRCSADDKLLLLDHDGDGVASLLTIATWDDDSATRLPSAKWANYQALELAPELDAFAWADTGLPPDLAQRWRPQANAAMLAKDFPAFGPIFGRDRIIDVQGDGLPDVIRYQLTVGDASDKLADIKAQLFADDDLAEQGGLRLWVNTGAGFRDGGWITVGEPGGALAQEFVASGMLDWNGDGRLDLLKGKVELEAWEVWVSTGEGFERQDWPNSP